MEKRESTSASPGDGLPSPAPDLSADAPTADAATAAAGPPSSAAAAATAATSAADATEVPASPAGLSATPGGFSRSVSAVRTSPAVTFGGSTRSPGSRVEFAAGDSFDVPSPGARHSGSLLRHPSSMSLLPEAHPSAAATAARSRWWRASSSSSTAEAAARLAVPPALPPAPWLWDSSLLESFFVASTAAEGERGDSSAAAAAAAGESPLSPPSAALFLLPTSGGSVLRLEEAYVCESCCAIRAPEELSVEIEAYYCPSCFDSLTQAEALACGCSCTKCFDCPRCCACLSVMRQPRAAAAAAADRGLEDDAAAAAARPALPGDTGEEQESVDAAAVAAAHEAEAVVRRLLLREARRSRRPGSEEEEEKGKHEEEEEEEGAPQGVSAAESALLAAAAPQRCESLLSLSSEDEDEDSEQEGQQVAAHDRAAAAAAADAEGRRESDTPSYERRSSSDASEEKTEEEEVSGTRQGRNTTQEDSRGEQKYLYYFACPYCRWDSQVLQITSESAALLPAAAIAEERVGGLLQRYFHQVLDVLQRAARDTERLRQLEARLKHKAVALLFAAAAAHDKRRGSVSQLQQQRGERRDDAAASAATGAAAAEGADEQLLLGTGMAGGSKSWRVTDLEQALTERAAQNTFAHASKAWAAAYRSALQQPPQYVELQQLLRGEHALLSEQEEEKVMTDVLFGWQLQQHEAEQLLRRGTASPEAAGSDTHSRRGSVFQENAFEGTGERRRSSIDTTIETPLAVPLHAPQLLLDRPSPDAPPVQLPPERLRGSLLFSETCETHNSSGGSKTGSAGGCRHTGKKALEEWWTAEQATLEQRLRSPNRLIAAATSTSLLRPTRKKLLTRESKRCRTCTRYLVKAHVSSIAVPPFRVNTAAALLLPWIVPMISKSGQLLRPGEIADLQLNLLNPTDRPLRLRFRFTHVVAQTPAALNVADRQQHESKGASAAGTGAATQHSAVLADKTGRGEASSHEAGAADAAAAAGSDTVDSSAFFTAAEDTGKRAETEQDAEQRRKGDAVTELSTDWETLQILTPDFELHLDRYDDMLGEFGDLDFAYSSRGTSKGSSCGDGFRSPSTTAAAVEWKKGNSAQVRLQVQAKKNDSKKTAQQQLAVCCLTLDIDTTALQTNTLRVQYLLFLGHVSATEKA